MTLAQTRIDEKEDLTIELLAREAADDTGLVGRLTDLVNDVYEAMEGGLWRDGHTRTTASEVAELIRAGEIALATRGGQIAGSVRIRDIAADMSEFGILVATPAYRGTGVGRALVDFAERVARERGMRAMRLELLVPHTGSHPSKEFLKDWYGRRGYRLVCTGSFADAYPRQAPLLARPCYLEVHEKPLGR